MHRLALARHSAGGRYPFRASMEHASTTPQATADPEVGVRFFYGLLLALAISMFIWLALSLGVYMLVVR